MDVSIKNNIFDNLNEKQRDIVEDCDSNLYVTACPGSGKTRTLTRKIAYMKYLFPDSLKKVIAITYTNRAANEIHERLEILGVDGDNVWVGTIHQFCLEFILRKFGINSKRTARGIKIIDEYISKKYLKECADKLGVKYNLYDNLDLRCNTNGIFLETDAAKLPLIKAYHEKLKENNEIDFDLILTISLVILERNPVANEIIAKTIRSIYVDEFQDTSEVQYQIINKLAHSSSNIKFMFVGDADQAIFTSLGGVVKTKKEIEDLISGDFIEKTLDGCYRSSQKIVDFYTQFQQNSYSISSFANIEDKDSIFCYDKNIHKDKLSDAIAGIIQSSLESGISENEICIIAPNQFILNPIGKELKEKLPSVNFRSQDIYPIKPDDLSLFYKISFLVFTTRGKRIGLRKKIADEVIEMLKLDFAVDIKEDFINIDLLDLLNATNSSREDGLEYLNEKILGTFQKMEISEEKYPVLFSQKNDFFDKARERIDNPKLQLSTDIENFRAIYEIKTGINLSTIHKAKGEEYDVVIAFGFLDGIVPFFKSNNPKIESEKLLYVTAYRARKNLFLFSEQGRPRNSAPTPVLRTVKFL